MNSGAVFVSEELRIPRDELSFRASKSGGPGGQHVNTSSTRIELLWSVRNSRALTDDQRARLTAKLGTRLDGDGGLRIVASEHRSQARNRDEAEERLAKLVRRALVVPRVRRTTRPTRSGIEKRLESKKREGAKKRARRERDFD
ncbi:MAG TPA: alternative ribosome rescue aminoacyl-tRNA hydrolase ArfB [Gemmatimonadaceae bacterium]